MNGTGLTPDEIEQIISVLRRVPEITEAWLYGSRAKGNFRLQSDIDIALAGIEGDLKAAEIAEELEELPMPYRFDVKAYSAIRYPPLRDHIDRVGIKLYGKSAGD